MSAAGIFQSNLVDNAQPRYAEMANRNAFHQALGGDTLDDLHIYERTQAVWLQGALNALGVAEAATTV